MTSSNFGTVVDVDTIRAIAPGLDLASFLATARGSKGRGRKAQPFAVVARYGRTRGVFFRLKGQFQQFGKAARAREALRVQAIPAWIVLAPGFTLAPRAVKAV